MDARDRPDFTAIVDVLLDLSETIPSHTSTNTNCVTSNKQNVPSHNNSKSNISAVTQSKTAKMHEIDSLDSLIRRK